MLRIKTRRGRRISVGVAVRVALGCGLGLGADVEVAVETGVGEGESVAGPGWGADSGLVAGKLPQPVKRPSAIHTRKSEKKVFDIS
jgi:hypothetical protein